ncbi:GNAT family N-acetyltransferase [Cognatiluteimonas profundi]|uniref:GNAT family N-acetyltransferase n=1 Tax=Cognatiluteimonas profundi TaxID=2594501 RepID=UPI0018EF1143|nr:GNAT family protein [Lysobacter profundi]
MTGWTMPAQLRGSHVSLEPLTDAHAADLRAASDDGALWRSWYANVPAPDAIDAYIAAALAMRDAGTAFPFVVKDVTGAVVGSTRYYDIDASVPRLSIGYTWYARSAQRTGLNTEAKLLLLGHAFESLDCISVGLKTSWFNHASRAAIARLGAKQDGVLRSHQRHADGSVRDTVVFSIIASEWPAVKTNLLARLAAHA